MDKKKITKKEVNQKLARLIKQNKDEKAKLKHVKLSFMENRFGPLVFVLLFAGIGSFFIFRSSAAPIPQVPASPTPILLPHDQTSTAPATPASIWIQPSEQKVAIGTTFTAEVLIDTAETQVNAVEADLTYPVDKLQFVSIDAADSAFSVQAQADGADGKVSIARGSVTPLSGKQVVARVVFKSLVASGTAAVSLNDSSSILKYSDNSNILSKRTGAEYTFTN